MLKREELSKLDEYDLLDRDLSVEKIQKLKENIKKGIDAEKRIIAYNDFLMTAMNKDLDCVDINLAKRDDSTIYKQGELNVHPCGYEQDDTSSLPVSEKEKWKKDLANSV